MNSRLFRSGTGIRCDDIDEDIGLEELLPGKPSGLSQRSFNRWLPLLSLVIAACAPDAWRPDDRYDDGKHPIIISKHPDRLACQRPARTLP